MFDIFYYFLKTTPSLTHIRQSRHTCRIMPHRKILWACFRYSQLFIFCRDIQGVQEVEFFSMNFQNFATSPSQHCVKNF